VHNVFSLVIILCLVGIFLLLLALLLRAALLLDILRGVFFVFLFIDTFIDRGGVALDVVDGNVLLAD
jgi:hypothetical protein